jgi:hypothetical protein
MKTRSVVSLMLIGMIFSAVAPAQDKPAPEKAEPLSFIKIAADVAANVQQQSLNNFLAIYVDDTNWAAAEKDSDLGPFLKLKDAGAKPGRSAAFFFTGEKDAAIVVYLDGRSPFGVVSVKAASRGGTIHANDIAPAYKPVSKDMLKKGDQEWHFNQIGVNTDDGTSLPAFQITK